MIMPRIWPLNQIPDDFTKEVSESTRLEKLPEGKTALAHGFDEATIVGLKAPGVKEFFKTGIKTVIDMWFVILPSCKSIRNFTYWFCRYVFTFYLNSDGAQ